MREHNRRWVVLAFAASLLIVGIPYWAVPYERLTLPTALLRPGLAVVALAPLLLLARRVAGFALAVTIIAAAVPAVVMARVIADAVRDSSAHNLWPIELMIALVLGLGCALPGGIVGGVLGKLRSIRANRAEAAR